MCKREDVSKEILEEWGELQQSLHNLFKERNKELVKEPMQRGIALFIEFLQWVNGNPVGKEHAMNYEQLRIKPVNIEERLSYILTRPNAYPSYMQLIELMKELEKQYEKSMAIKRTMPDKMKKKH